MAHEDCTSVMPIMRKGDLCEQNCTFLFVGSGGTSSVPLDSRCRQR